MRLRQFVFILPAIFNFGMAGAQAATPTKNLIVDQLGYRASAPQKMAVIANPQTGYNAPNPITPSANFQIRRASDNATVYTGSLTAWNGGATDTVSGDQAWWADFSSFNTPGTYYLYETASGQSSYNFQVRDDIYNAPLAAVVKFYFYQRCGCTIDTAHGGNWTHAACHLGANQDKTAQLWYGGAAHGSPKDVSGGWHDAGDYGKYVEFVVNSVWNLLYAYENYPNRFSDNTNIPESGNGVPDILDEVKWELDWLLKMQNPDYSVASKVGFSSGNDGASPPENCTATRYYALSSTAAASTFCALTAYGARIFKNFNTQYPGYANTLLTASQNTWTWLQAHPGLINTDNTGFANANTAVTAGQDGQRRVWAAAELFAATGNPAYQSYFDANYNVPQDGTHNPITSNYFDPIASGPLEMGMVTYASLSSATPSVVSAIKTSLKNGIEWNVTGNDLNDPYRAYMWTGHYTWGSNQYKAQWAELCLWGVKLGVNPANNQLYLNKAEEYLHYFHGRNPLSWVYITGMQNNGASNVVGHIFHSWFNSGNPLYDGNPPASTYGPAPGIIPGGPNQNFAPDASCACTIAPPQNQPPMKSYKDWGVSWPQDSWEVTEPDQGYSGPYVVLAAAFATNPAPTATPSPTLTGTPPTSTVTPSPSPTFSASPSASPTPCLTTVLFNGLESMAENGNWSGGNAQRSTVTAASAPAGAITQGNHAMLVNVTVSAGWSDSIMNLDSFSPSDFSGVTQVIMDINVDPALVAGSSYANLQLYADSASAGKWYQPIASNAPALVAGQNNNVTWNISFSAGTLVPSNPLSRLLFIFNNNSTSAVGRFYIDNIRLVRLCTMPSPTATASPSVSPSTTPSISSTATPSITPSPSATPSLSRSPSFTASPSASPSITLAATLTVSPTVSVSPSVTLTFTNVPLGSTNTATPSISPSPSATPSVSPTVTLGASFSVSPSGSPSATAWVTPSPTLTPTGSTTPSISPTATLRASSTATISPSPSFTASDTSSATGTPTSVVPSITNSPSPSITLTPSPSLSSTVSISPSASATVSSSQSLSPSPSAQYSALSTSTSSPVGAVNGSGKVLKVVAVPNPQSGPLYSFRVLLDGPADHLDVKVYSEAFILVGSEAKDAGLGAGWNWIRLSLPGLSNGPYYLVVKGAANTQIGKWASLK